MRSPRSGLTLATLSDATTAELREIVPAFGSAENPIDVTATVMNDRTLVRRALDAVATDPDVDVIVVCFCVLTGADADAVVVALSDARATHGKPIVVARTGADHLPHREQPLSVRPASRATPPPRCARSAR